MILRKVYEKKTFFLLEKNAQRELLILERRGNAYKIANLLHDALESYQEAFSVYGAINADRHKKRVAKDIKACKDDLFWEKTYTLAPYIFIAVAAIGITYFFLQREKSKD